MAQWLRHRLTERGAASSNPAGALPRAKYEQSALFAWPVACRTALRETRGDAPVSFAAWRPGRAVLRKCAHRLMDSTFAFAALFLLRPVASKGGHELEDGARRHDDGICARVRADTLKSARSERAPTRACYFFSASANRQAETSAGAPRTDTNARWSTARASQRSHRSWREGVCRGDDDATTKSPKGGL